MFKILILSKLLLLLISTPGKTEPLLKDNHFSEKILERSGNKTLLQKQENPKNELDEENSLFTQVRPGLNRLFTQVGNAIEKHIGEPDIRYTLQYSGSIVRIPYSGSIERNDRCSLPTKEKKYINIYGKKIKRLLSPEEFRAFRLNGFKDTCPKAQLLYREIVFKRLSN